MTSCSLDTRLCCFVRQRDKLVYGKGGRGSEFTLTRRLEFHHDEIDNRRSGARALGSARPQTKGADELRANESGAANDCDPHGPALREQVQF